MLPQVKLFDVGGGTFPFVQRQLLTEESEMEIFGNIRRSMFDGDTRRELAIIDQENVDLYNDKIARIYHGNPGFIPHFEIVAGVVEVDRVSSYNVRLNNVNQKKVVLFEEE